MAKFTADDLRTLQSWQRHIKTSLQKLDKLNTTAKYWNSKGHLAVLKTHAYIINDLIESLGYYKKAFNERLNSYSEINFGLSEIAKTNKAKPAAKKKTLSARGYKRPAFDLETTGTYIFKTPKKDYIVNSYLFERENDTEDSLQIQNELRDELGAIIIKNSAWRNLANGKTITARSSKGQKGKLTKLK